MQRSVGSFVSQTIETKIKNFILYNVIESVQSISNELYSFIVQTHLHFQYVKPTIKSTNTIITHCEFKIKNDNLLYFICY